MFYANCIIWTGGDIFFSVMIILGKSEIRGILQNPLINLAFVKHTLARLPIICKNTEGGPADFCK